MKRLLIIASFLTFSGHYAFSQCGPLTTLYAGNNGQDGIMFDITALQSVVITHFDIDAYGNTHTYEIYTKTGTHVGFATTPGAWTLLGTAANVPGNPRNSPTSIPITLSIPMCAGDTRAFYITAIGTSGSVSYTNGTAVGNVYAADANIQIKEGTGKDYPFGASFTPRIPNITCYYNCAVSCCLPPNMTQGTTSCSTTCDGTATATVPAGGFPPFSYLWNAAAGNQTTQTATGLCPGSYTVSVTDNTGCVSTGTVTVAAGPVPPTPVITPAGPFCLASPATNLSATPVGGTWAGTGITNAAAGTFNPAVSGIGTFVITYTSPGACSASATTNITVNSNSNATITPAGPFCQGDPAVNLTAATGGGTWSGTGITNAANGTFNPATAGPGTHTITYTIGGSCGSTDTENIIVNANFDATITPAGPFCPGDPALNLTAADPGGTWSGTGITNATTGTFDPAVAGAGSHTITYTIAGTCGDVQTTTVVVNSSFDATINPAGPFCESSAALNLTAVDTGGTWSGTGITNASAGTFDPATAGAGTFTITYTISGSCGSSDTENITVDPNMDATITPAGPFCPGDPAVNLTAVDGGGTWSGTGITDAVLGTFDPSASGAGSFTITYTIAGTCGDSQTTAIVVNNTLDPTISPAGPFCESSASVNLTAVDAGGTWSGTGITNAAAGTFNPATAGAGTFTITYTIPGSCGSSDTENIVVNADMNATITPAGPFCVGSSPVSLTAADPGGTWSGTGITDPANGVFDPAAASTGTFTITYTIGGMCGDTQTASITVNANDDATITAAGPFCVDAASVTLTAATSGGTWSGQGITNAATGIFDPATATAGTWQVTYMISGSCGDTSTINIVVNPLPVVSFTADNLSGCEPVQVTFTNTTPGGSSSCAWDFGGMGTSTSCGTVTASFPAGSYTISLTTTDMNGCTGSLTNSAMINSFSFPTAGFTASPQPTNIYDPHIYFTDQSLGGTTYFWDFGGLSSSTLQNPDFIFPDAGTYPVTLIVSSGSGCVDSITQDIVINQGLLLYVPNAFVPDGNGRNDVFIPVISGYQPGTYQLYIFNRWGEQVFYTEDVYEGWDGKHKGIKSPSDVYIWKLIVAPEGSPEVEPYMGHVTLLR